MQEERILSSDPEGYVSPNDARVTRFKRLTKKFEDKHTLSFDPDDPEVQKDLQAIAKVAVDKKAFIKWIGQFEKKPQTIGSTAANNPEEILRLFAQNTGTPPLDELPDVSWGEVAKGLNPLSIPTDEGLGPIPGSPFWGSFAKGAKDIVGGVPHLIPTLTRLMGELASLPNNIIADIDNDLDPTENKAFSETSPILNALMMGYKQKYGSLRGFKYTLATDAWSVILDAADFVAPVLKGVKGAGMAAKAARGTGKTLDAVNPGEWLGNVVGAGVTRWTDHMKANPGALSDVEVSFGIAEDGTPLTMKINLEELANEYGGVENIPLTALVTEDLPKHIEEAIINLYDSKHPYHQKVIERYQKTGQAIVDKQAELVGKGNYWDAEAVGEVVLGEYENVRDGNYTTLGKKQAENAEILNQPLTVLDETPQTSKILVGYAPTPEQIAAWEEADDIYFRVVREDISDEAFLNTKSVEDVDSTKEEMAERYGYYDQETYEVTEEDVDRFFEDLEAGDIDGLEEFEWLEEDDPQAHQGEGLYATGVAAGTDINTVANYAGSTKFKGDTKPDIERLSGGYLYVFRGNYLNTLFDGVTVEPTEIIEKIELPTATLDDTPRAPDTPPEAPETPPTPTPREKGLQLAEKLFPSMTAAIDELVARDSGTRDAINNKQLKSIVNDIDRMFVGLQQKYEQQGHLTLQDIKQFRTDFNDNMDIFARQGDILKLGSTSPSKRIAQGLFDDFYTLLKNEVETNPSKYPENFDAVVRADQADYADLMKLEDTPIGNYLRGKKGKEFQIVNDVLNPSGIFTKDNIEVLKQAIGEKGWKHVQHGALAQIFLKSRALNRDMGELALLNQLNKIGGGGRNRLNAIFGEEMTQTLYKMANLQQRVFGKRGKWNTPYINEILRSDPFGDIMIASGMVTSAFADDISKLAQNTGLARKLGQSSEKVGLVVGLLAWWGAKRAKDKMFSEAGREAILNGRSITFRDKTVVSARQIALVADWMDKNSDKIHKIWEATRTGFRPASQAKRRREKEERMRRATLPPYRGAMPFEFYVE